MHRHPQRQSPARSARDARALRGGRALPALLNCLFVISHPLHVAFKAGHTLQKRGGRAHWPGHKPVRTGVRRPWHKQLIQHHRHSHRQWKQSHRSGAGMPGGSSETPDGDGHRRPASGSSPQPAGIGSRSEPCNGLPCARCIRRTGPGGSWGLRHHQGCAARCDRRLEMSAHARQSPARSQVRKFWPGTGCSIG
jgi:hypothetical protein